ncbi:DnaJ domain containing protein [Amanita muscaria]
MTFRGRFSLSEYLAVDKSNLDFYQVLAVPRHASPDDIKAAYHRALLTFHPDKQHPQLRHGAAREGEVSIPLIREAYATLSHPESRKQYDTALLHAASHGFAGKPGSRPAQVVSLEEFVVERPDQDGKTNSNGSEGQQDGWASETYTYPCRCGGKYRLTTEDLENGHHLVGCECCSEVIWVGYEEIIEDGEDIR